ncbi:oxidoreductase [Devosia aurantiaca]|uniref:SDR family NAD(P)-dependent oxidoreductase n=1 Tax=Devosia aurantiaca TaxID=2714858 RepID=A0A6M1SHP3_9HYPH|nr:oxidoreductase [Devosia aurantiaca]NGP16384.1 SDR family NAD(P)-dependent oxidoreductase [Devosia aurantiaca]
MPITSPAEIPNLSGKLAAVTGATGGLGIEAARMLSGAGAHVVLIGRNADKGAEAIRTIAATNPKGTVAFEQIDLADLADVAAGAARLSAEYDHLDILINNAGVMAPRERKTTKDGFELQFGTNHLAHFALTGRLLPLLQKSGNARVVSVASLAAMFGKIDFDDLEAQRGYDAMRVYGQSKLANLLFTEELGRRSLRNDWNITAVAAHPGLARTDLVANGPGEGGIAGVFGMLLNPIFSHSAAEGALPLIVAATDPNVSNGDYWGPKDWMGLKGKPAKAKPPKAAADADVARRLWEKSEHLTKVSYPESSGDLT